MHQLSSGLTVGLLVSGGRVRVPIALGEQFENSWIIISYSSELNLFALEMVGDQDGSDATEIRQLFDVYGYVSLERDDETGGLDSVMGIPAANLEAKEHGDLSIPDETGWIEGVCRYGVNGQDGLALVHNGILYPLINEVDPSAGDEEQTVDELLTKSDNVLAPLGQMIATPDRFLSVGAVSSPWGEVESGLHQDSPLEVSALVINDNDVGNINLENLMIWYQVQFPLPYA